MGSLISGQLLENTSLDTAGLFQYTCVIVTIVGLIILATYHVIGKKYEKILVANKQALLDKVKKEESGGEASSGLKGSSGDSIKSMMKVQGSWGAGSYVSTQL